MTSHTVAVVSELQPYRFVADYDDEQVYDVIGTAFEVYMADHLKGEKGQWFTNRLLVGAMVEMLAPTDKDVILDPACGPGGFLVACLRRVRRHIAQTTPSQVAQHSKFLKASKRVFGIDVAPHLVKVAKTNMILNGDGHGGIVRGNTLQSPVKLPPEFKLRPDAGRFKLRPTRIFANPPFGDNPELRVKDTEILTQFEVGHEWERSEGHWLRKTSRIVTGGVPPELLFLERCIDWLEPGGKLGIVIARGALDNVKALAARQYVLRHARLLGVIHAHPNTFKPFNGTKASVLLVEKKAHVGFEHDEDYPVFMAINQSIGQDSEGRDVYKRDKNGQVELGPDGVPVLDHDLNLIAQAWAQFERGEEPEYEAAWTVPLSRITSTAEMRLNPTRYAPKAEAALSAVLEMAGSDEWEVEQIGDFATVFEGERFTRPYAQKGVDSGEGIVRYYTPKAFFEARGESSKYLDWNRANATQERQLTELTLEPDWIVIANAGTAKKGALVGRVGLTTTEHAGSIGSNNLTRIVVKDPEKRAYLYRFLRSELGRELLLRNVYGTNQDHVDLDDVKRVPIPFPKDKTRFHAITKRVEEVKRLRERAAILDKEAGDALDSVLEDVVAASAKESRESPLPFPDTDLSPATQRTIQRMIDEGDEDGAADFLTQLGKASVDPKDRDPKDRDPKDRE